MTCRASECSPLAASICCCQAVRRSTNQRRLKRRPITSCIFDGCSSAAGHGCGQAGERRQEPHGVASCAFDCSRLAASTGCCLFNDVARRQQERPQKRRKGAMQAAAATTVATRATAATMASEAAPARRRRPSGWKFRLCGIARMAGIHRVCDEPPAHLSAPPSRNQTGCQRRRS